VVRKIRGQAELALYGIESLAIKLGADVYFDSKLKNPAEELQKLGGARVIIATAPDPKSMTRLIGGLGPNGKLLLIGLGPGSNKSGDRGNSLRQACGLLKRVNE
jgi:D-arabinose 1-dehydrogenase-like Zn-dependent alcohol dehydrogenase